MRESFDSKTDSLQALSDGHKTEWYNYKPKWYEDPSAAVGVAIVIVILCFSFLYFG